MLYLKAQTKTRLDLCRMIKHMAEGFESAWLTNPNRPIVISIDGDIDAGKSLIARIIKDTILANGVDHFEGKLDHAERWIGQFGEDVIEVNFLNTARGCCTELDHRTCHVPTAHNFKSAVLDIAKAKKEQDLFLYYRERGGIVLLTNSSHEGDINISLTYPHKLLPGEGRFSNLLDMHDEFSELADQKWVRELSIAVMNEDMSQSPAFSQAFEDMQGDLTPFYPCYMGPPVGHPAPL